MLNWLQEIKKQLPITFYTGYKTNKKLFAQENALFMASTRLSHNSNSGSPRKLYAFQLP